jgi:hypothetical protein
MKRVAIFDTHTVRGARASARFNKDWPGDVKAA